MTCDVCGMRSQVASTTRFSSTLGNLAALVLWGWVLIARHPSGLLVFLSLPVVLLCGYFAAWLTLRLVPADSDE